MDASQEYINMCEKATEIQEFVSDDHIKEILPAFFYDKEFETVEIGVWFPESFREEYNIEYVIGALTINETGDKRSSDSDWEGVMIWLPRQDQLQAIVDVSSWVEDQRYTIGLMDILDNFVYDGICITPHSQGFKSMEKLWLACVMYNKYNKEWTGTDWEAIE